MSTAIDAFLDFVKAIDLDLTETLKYIDDLHRDNRDQHADRVLITSVHRSKGLEFPLIILPDLAESKFPHYKVNNGDSITKSPSKAQIESERRLFYVAVTRAKERLALACPNDPRLVKWIEERRGGYPDEIEHDSMAASRFVYEANLKLSAELGRMLHSGMPKTPLKAAEPDLANRYLMTLGIPFRVGKDQRCGRGACLRTGWRVVTWPQASQGLGPRRLAKDASVRDGRDVTPS